MTEPTRYPLHDVRILPPYFFSRGGVAIRGIVDAPGTVAVERDHFRFVGAHPPVGTEMIVQNTRDGLVALTVADVEAKDRADEEERKRLQHEAELRRREQADRDRAEAEAFNAALALPFKWSSAFRVHSSGVSRSGHGSGVFANSVTHIRCDEPIAVGRLKREAQAVLCGGGEGAMWLADDQGRDGKGEKYDSKVTCKACIAAAERIRARIPA